MNYYRTLGVPFNATRKEIKQAYRERARACHPDLHPEDPAAAQKFQALNRSYENLIDPDLRKKYHRFLMGHMRKKTPPKGPRPLTEEERKAFRAALEEQKRIIRLRKKVMMMVFPSLTLLVYAVLMVWAWNNQSLNWQYGVIMLVASAFLALPVTALTWILSFEVIRRRIRKQHTQ